MSNPILPPLPDAQKAEIAEALIFYPAKTAAKKIGVKRQRDLDTLLADPGMAPALRLARERVLRSVCDEIIRGWRAAIRDLRKIITGRHPKYDVQYRLKASNTLLSMGGKIVDHVDLAERLAELERRVGEGRS
jgi:hypothetical protein